MRHSGRDTRSKKSRISVWIEMETVSQLPELPFHENHNPVTPIERHHSHTHTHTHTHTLTHTLAPSAPKKLMFRWFTEPGYSQWIVWLSGAVQTGLYLDIFYYYLTRVVWGEGKLQLPA